MTIESIRTEAAEIYADLHGIAEPAWKEYRTSAYIAEYLERLGVFEVTRGIAGGTGVMAVLKGPEPGENLGIRADIDALLFNTPDGGVECIHACGHDAHTSMVLALAARVAREGIRRGTLTLIFQPAEEVDTGSRAVIRDGCIDRLDWLFATHLRPAQELSAGQCTPAMYHGSCYMIEAEILGRSSHAGRPHLGVNTAEIAVQVVNAVNMIHEDPNVQNSAKVTKIVAAEPSVNTIPRRAEIAIDLRAQTNEIMKDLIARVTRIIEATSEMCGGSARIKTPEGVPAAQNHPAAVALAREAMAAVIGEENIVEKVVSPGGDDFHYYTTTRPEMKATYMGLGCGLLPGLHSPDMHFDLSALARGVDIYSHIVRKILQD